VAALPLATSGTRHGWRSFAGFQRRDPGCETLERVPSLVLTPFELADVVPGPDRERERSKCDEPPHQRSASWHPA